MSAYPHGDAGELLDDWRQRAQLALFAYNRSANRCRVWDTRIGGGVAVLTAVTGTSVFATLNDDVSVAARVVVGLITLAAAVFSGIQAFAGLGQRIEDYERAARRFGSIRRRIEIDRVLLAEGKLDISKSLGAIREELDAAATESPNCTARVWNRTRRHMKGEYTIWERAIVLLRGLPRPQPLRSVSSAETPRTTAPSGPAQHH